MEIEKGCILLARKIQESEIWTKPASWFKIWVYILQRVNYARNGMFEKGENFFQYQVVALECGEKYNSVVKFIRWAKAASLVATRKTTRGTVIIVLNYEQYQSLGNYKNKASGKTPVKSTAKQRQDRGNTIIKEGNITKERKGNFFWDENMKNMRRQDSLGIVNNLGDKVVETNGHMCGYDIAIDKDQKHYYIDTSDNGERVELPNYEPKK